jgi:hypothetical protein
VSNSLIVRFACRWRPFYDVSLINTFTQRRHFNLCRAAIVRVTSAKVFLTFSFFYFISFESSVHQHSRVHRQQTFASTQNVIVFFFSSLIYKLRSFSPLLRFICCRLLSGHSQQWGEGDYVIALNKSRIS